MKVLLAISRILLMKKILIIRYGKQPNALDVLSFAPPIKKNNNAWARSNQEKANVHADHLEKVFQSHPRQTAEENLIARDCEDDTPITPVSLKEVWETKTPKFEKSPRL